MLKWHLTIVVILFTYHSVLADSVEKVIESNHEHIRQFLDTDLDSALILADQALAYAEAKDNTWGIGYAYFFKAYISEDQKNLGDAIVFYLKALEYMNELNTEDAIIAKIKIFDNCGIILSEHFKYDEAIEFYIESINLAETHNLKIRLLVSCYNRASAYENKGDYDAAIRDIGRSLSLSREFDDELMTVKNLNLLGITYKKSKKYDLAKKYYREIIDFDFRQLEPDEHIGRAYHNLGSCFLVEKLYEEAESNYLKALDYNLRLATREFLFVTYMDLADLYLTTGRLAEALEMGIAADQVYSAVPLKPNYYKIYEILRNIYHQKGDHEKEDYYAKAYQNENERFLEEQQHVMELRNRLSMDLVLAELNRKQHQKAATSPGYWIPALVVVMIIGLSFYVRRSYRLAQRNLPDDSEI